jgi:serine phosphatase RsbU (regulator of sigma subunit)
MKKLILLLLVGLLSPLKAQINFDTINRTIDTTVKVRKKMTKAIGFAKNKTLTNPEIEFLRTKVLEIGTKKKELPFAYLQLSILYYGQKKFNDAISFSFKSLKGAENANDTLIMAHANYRLGFAYRELKNFPYAKKHFHYTISLSKNVKNEEELGETYNVMGTIFKNEGLLDSALEYNKKAMPIRIKLGDKKGLASTYNNLGLVYKKKKDFDLALDYLTKALELRTELNDRKGMAGASINMGNVLVYQEKYKKALDLIIKGTGIAREIKDGDFYKNGIDALADCYYYMGDYKKAADYKTIYKKVNDSVATEVIDKQVAELTAQYESGKKDTEIAIQQAEIKAKTAQNSQQKIMIIASVIALLMALIAVFFIYRSFKQNKRNALQLSFKNKLIEEKNKEITDSINYARVIQQSLLAPETMLESNLTEHFILYKPKDIVSGDFYWGHETQKGFAMACVDCTGHGVPGAFMSLIGKENLDKAISKTNSPRQILSELNLGVKNSLKQNRNDGTKDGMDVALVKLEREQDGIILDYSGANRPIWIIRKDGDTIEETKATKVAIGGFTEDTQEFHEHKIKLNKGDLFYIFTDGFADQFGGEKQKKLTTRLFKELLLQVSRMVMQEQKAFLDDFYAHWKGENEQTDDILVIGVRV